MRRTDVPGGARRHRTFGSAFACRFAREGEPERGAPSGDDVVENEIAAHATHQRARDVEAQAAAVAAGAPRRAAFESPEQPGTILFVEAPAFVRDRGPQH